MIRSVHRGVNVKYHVQSMTMRSLFIPVDYRVQYRKWIVENHIAISDDNKWLQDLPTEKLSTDNHRRQPSKQILVRKVQQEVYQLKPHLSPLEFQLRTLKSDFIKLGGVSKLGAIISRTSYVLPL